jgi:putative ABC transport system permease protein
MKNPFKWFRRSRLDDISDEIRSHIEEKTDALVAARMSRADAEAAARRAFGNVTSTQEAARDVWRFESFIDGLGSDLRYALRGLRQKPGFTIAVILTLALGIGANAVVFAMVNALVLRPLPYPESERLVSIAVKNNADDNGSALHELAYAEWAGSTRSAVSSAAYAETQAVFATADGPQKIIGINATPAYFGIFGVRPLLGRTFDDGEALPGGPNVVVLSEPLWRERFGGDQSLVGRSVSVDGQPRFVIGILPASFTTGRVERFWLPLRVAPLKLPPGPSGEWIGYSAVARLRPEATLEGLRTEVATVLGRLRAEGHNYVGRTPDVMTLHERRHGETRRPLLLLFGAVGVLLLTACANIANLALARAARREREFALRLALGASRWRIVRFVLIENLALSAGGAMLGFLLVTASLGWFVRVSPSAIQSTETIGVSGALVTYTSVVAILTALLFGLVPALTASRTALSQMLATGTSHAAGSRRQAFARRALVVGELAVALVFLTGAGLVTKTFWRVTSVDPGLQAEHVLVADVELRHGYTGATALPIFDALITRVRSEPGVQAASWSIGAPLTGAFVRIGCCLQKLTGRWRDVPVDPAYLEAIGGQLVAGRFIGPEDRKGAPRVMVVTEEYARMYLGAAPLGRTHGRGKWLTTVVGVVKDIVQEATDGKRHPIVFRPLAQSDEYNEFTKQQLIVRTTGPTEPLEKWIRAEFKTLEALSPPPKFSTMEQALAERIAPRKFTLVLLVWFAALTGGLAIIGLYSVLSYLVAERTREIGIRIAIGAIPARVSRMVLGQGLRLTLIGIAAGGILSIAAVRVLRAWMYEMSVYDAPTFAAVAVLLCLVALLASWLPARRAGRVDPVQALRAE